MTSVTFQVLRTAVAQWEATISCEIYEREDVVTTLNAVAKFWAFQQEKAESGYIHFQCMFSLKVKTRDPRPLLRDNNAGQWSVRVISKAGTSAAGWYVEKAETRIAGPWRSTDTVPLTPHFQHKVEAMYPFQRDIFESAQTPHPRNINMLINFDGCNGKSMAAALGYIHHNAIILPPFETAKEMTQAVHGLYGSDTSSRLIFIDLPRARAKQMASICEAVETIKSGFIHETRNRARMIYVASPTIWIFSNFLPYLNDLTPDRWRFFNVNTAHELVPVSHRRLRVMEIAYKASMASSEDDTADAVLTIDIPHVESLGSDSTDTEEGYDHDAAEAWVNRGLPPSSLEAFRVSNFL